MVIKMTYNTMLKEIRLEKSLTQAEVAEAIGINRVQYNQYENNYFNIPIKHLISMSNYFEKSIDYILGLSSTETYINSKTKINTIEAGTRLKEFRKENNLTQEKLAKLLKTTFSNIGFYEKGRNLIATPFLYEICKKYQISADYLLGKTDKPKYLK